MTRSVSQMAEHGAETEKVMGNEAYENTKSDSSPRTALPVPTYSLSTQEVI